MGVTASNTQARPKHEKAGELGHRPQPSFTIAGTIAGNVRLQARLDRDCMCRRRHAMHERGRRASGEVGHELAARCQVRVALCSSKLCFFLPITLLAAECRQGEFLLFKSYRTKAYSITMLETAKEILAEVFHARPGEVDEMIQRRLEEKSVTKESELWPATFYLGE